MGERVFAGLPAEFYGVAHPNPEGYMGMSAWALGQGHKAGIDPPPPGVLLLLSWAKSGLSACRPCWLAGATSQQGGGGCNSPPSFHQGILSVYGRG